MRIGGEATSRDEGHCKGDVCIGGCVCICVHKQYIPIKSLEEILRLRSKLRATGSTTCREDSLSQTKIQNNTQYIPMFKERERERERVTAAEARGHPQRPHRHGDHHDSHDDEDDLHRNHRIVSYA